MVNKTVGVIGLGAMGSGIVSTLLRNFYTVGVYDIDSDRMDRCVRAGAVRTQGVGALAAEYSTVLLSLPSSHVAVEVIERQLLPSAGPGTTVIDMGTTVVAETERLAAAFEKKGAILIDAPVSGGPIGAAKGELYCFVGGRREAAQGVWPLLSVLSGARLTYCGESGSGQVTKGVNQLAMGLVSAAYTEAVAYGVTAGVDADVLLRAVGGSGGFRGQFEAIAGRVVGGDGDVMDHKHAEYDYFLHEADRRGFPAPILRGLAQFLDSRPASRRDNVNRPYAPLWSALTDTGT